MECLQHNPSLPFTDAIEVFESFPVKNCSFHMQVIDIILAYAHIKWMEMRPDILLVSNSYLNNEGLNSETIMSQM